MRRVRPPPPESAPDVRDDMFKGLKIMSLGVINHSMSLSVQTNFEKTMFVQA